MIMIKPVLDDNHSDTHDDNNNDDDNEDDIDDNDGDTNDNYNNDDDNEDDIANNQDDIDLSLLYSRERCMLISKVRRKSLKVRWTNMMAITGPALPAASCRENW